MENIFKFQDLILSAPQMILISGALLILLLQVVLPGFRRVLAFYIALISLFASLYVVTYGIPGTAFYGLLSGNPEGGTVFQGNLRLNSYIQHYSFLILLAVTIMLFFIKRVFSEQKLELAEVYQFLLYIGAGSIFTVSANDLMTMFIGLELSSLPFFILAAWDRGRATATEAAVKYYFLSTIGIAFMLLGIALVYGGSGSTRLSEVLPVVFAEDSFSYKLLAAGWFLIIGGFLFKIAVVPFHGWVADVYDGAPSVITAAMASIVKISAVGAVFRILQFMQPDMHMILNTGIIVFAVASMVYGNMATLNQNYLKRVFAYSSIAHAGYIITMFMFFPESFKAISLRTEASSALYFYILAYALTSILAFATIAYLENGEERGLTFDHLKGLSKKNPFAAFLLSVSALSFAGIPPLAGFFGKLFLLKVLISAGYYYLAVVMIVTSLVGVYFYIRIVFYAYWDFEDENARSGTLPPFRGIFAWSAAIVTAVLVLGIGFYSESIFNFARVASELIQ